MNLLCPVLVLASVFLGLVTSQCLTKNDQRQTSPSLTSQQALYVGQQEFSLAMLHEVNKMDPTASIFFSPYSTYHALLLAYFIAKNQTEQTIKSTLKLPATHDKLDVMQAYRMDKFTRSMQEQANGSYEFSAANRIYVAPETGVRPCMIELFAEELQRVDFQGNPEAARVAINKWVETITKDQIKNLLVQNSIDENTNLVLVNAAYFKGKWVSQFDPDTTHKSVFYISGSEKTFVDMMSQEGTFNHEVSETLGAHILELPYIGKDISMYIFLPPFATDIGVDNVLAKLNSSTFQDIVKEGNMFGKQVFVSIPKFSMEQTIKLKPILDGLGMGGVFNADADLSLLTGERNVWLHDVDHKAKIVVDESGSEAAAATALISTRMAIDMPYTTFILESMGVGDLFDGGDLSALTGQKNVDLGDAVHKAKIEVSEDGTKAAAATAFFSFRSSRPAEPAMFICNHPFIYTIYDRFSQAILFAGVFRKP